MKRTATFYPTSSFPSGKNENPGDKRWIREDVSPGETVIRNLLNYSKALAVVKTPETGYIHMLMN